MGEYTEGVLRSRRDLGESTLVRSFGADESPILYCLHHPSIIDHVCRMGNVGHGSSCARTCLTSGICMARLLRACLPGGICMVRLLHIIHFGREYKNRFMFISESEGIYFG